jgi:hypothetical protein
MGVPISTWSRVFLPLLQIFDLPFQLDQEGKQRLEQLYDELGFLEFSKFSVFLCYVLTGAYREILLNPITFKAMLECNEVLFVQAIDISYTMFQDPGNHFRKVKQLWKRLI